MDGFHIWPGASHHRQSCTRSWPTNTCPDSYTALKTVLEFAYERYNDIHPNAKENMWLGMANLLFGFWFNGKLRVRPNATPQNIVVNNPLIRPYFLGGFCIGRVPSDFHDGWGLSLPLISWESKLPLPKLPPQEIRPKGIIQGQWWVVPQEIRPKGIIQGQWWVVIP